MVLPSVVTVGRFGPGDGQDVVAVPEQHGRGKCCCCGQDGVEIRNRGKWTEKKTLNQSNNMKT